jgi:uncharacterized protein YuzE
VQYRQYGDTPYIAFDNNVHAGYIKLADGTVAETREVHPSVLLDLDEDGALIGIEVLHRAFAEIGQRIVDHL